MAPICAFQNSIIPIRDILIMTLEIYCNLCIWSHWILVNGLCLNTPITFANKWLVCFFLVNLLLLHRDVASLTTCYQFSSAAYSMALGSLLSAVVYCAGQWRRHQKRLGDNMIFSQCSLNSNIDCIKRDLFLLCCTVYSASQARTLKMTEKEILTLYQYEFLIIRVAQQ